MAKRTQDMSDEKHERRAKELNSARQKRLRSRRTKARAAGSQQGGEGTIKFQLKSVDKSSAKRIFPSEGNPVWDTANAAVQHAVQGNNTDENQPEPSRTAHTPSPTLDHIPAAREAGLEAEIEELRVESQHFRERLAEMEGQLALLHTTVLTSPVVDICLETRIVDMTDHPSPDSIFISVYSDRIMNCASPSKDYHVQSRNGRIDAVVDVGGDTFFGRCELDWKAVPQR
ncbi:hypothetical protein OG21DRAFT_1526142 [Imleria badia]|nr:hypothetical protein OG21DRAFT_1526142 [Imleria badia]